MEGINIRPETAAWWPIGTVCTSIGLGRHALIAACERGEIPIRLQRFGERGLWYANAIDATAYLRDARRPLTETQQ